MFYSNPRRATGQLIRWLNMGYMYGKIVDGIGMDLFGCFLFWLKIGMMGRQEVFLWVVLFFNIEFSSLWGFLCQGFNETQFSNLNLVFMVFSVPTFVKLFFLDPKKKLFMLVSWDTNNVKQEDRCLFYYVISIRTSPIEFTKFRTLDEILRS